MSFPSAAIYRNDGHGYAYGTNIDDDDPITSALEFQAVAYVYAQGALHPPEAHEDELAYTVIEDDPEFDVSEDDSESDVSEYEHPVRLGATAKLVANIHDSASNATDNDASGEYAELPVDQEVQGPAEPAGALPAPDNLEAPDAQIFQNAEKDLREGLFQRFSNANLDREAVRDFLLRTWEKFVAESEAVEVEEKELVKGDASDIDVGSSVRSDQGSQAAKSGDQHNNDESAIDDATESSASGAPVAEPESPVAAEDVEEVYDAAHTPDEGIREVVSAINATAQDATASEDKVPILKEGPTSSTRGVKRSREDDDASSDADSEHSSRSRKTEKWLAEQDTDSELELEGVPVRKKARTERRDENEVPKETGVGAIGGGVRRLLWGRMRK
jgi:hypothetical protein